MSKAEAHSSELEADLNQMRKLFQDQQEEMVELDECQTTMTKVNLLRGSYNSYLESERLQTNQLLESRERKHQELKQSLAQTLA